MLYCIVLLSVVSIGALAYAIRQTRSLQRSQQIKRSLISACRSLASGNTVLPASLPDGEGAAALAIIAEVLAANQQQLHVLEDKLEAAGTRAGAAMDAASHLSHELRTPLSSIIGYCNLLLDELHGTLEPKQQEVVQTIASNANVLLSLINNLLDLSRLEAGKMALSERPVVIGEVLESALDMVEPMLLERGLEFQADLPEQPVQVIGSFDRLRQILVNLLGNAIKFTEHGYIRVSVSEQDGRVRIIVRDTGIGMTADQLPRVFERFQQADGNIRRQYGGSGLGLTITRKLVEWHRGSIHIESEQGHGTAVTLMFPSAAKGVSQEVVSR
jgi:signal transduction histidine kinase